MSRIFRPSNGKDLAALNAMVKINPDIQIEMRLFDTESSTWIARGNYKTMPDGTKELYPFRQPQYRVKEDQS